MLVTADPIRELEEDVHRLTNTRQSYAWGSRTAIPELFGVQPTGEPVAELWLGAHPSAPSRLLAGSGALGLDALIAADPEHALGADVVARFGPQLPYLLKLIAAQSSLSLQVHPHVERAREGFAAEDLAGVPLGAPHRNYRDRNHKPELVYALTPFEAMCGFRAPRRAAELLVGLGVPLATELHKILLDDPSAQGIRTAFSRLLEPATRPSAEQIDEVVQACARRLRSGSPSPRADRNVLQLAQAHPGDPGVVTSLLLNPVTLQPGEAMFVPAGGVHAYLNGLAVEIMANSDNVLRAGLTSKWIDVDELLLNVDYVAAPPIRIAPEVFHGATRVYYAPVDDFELSITVMDESTPHPLPGHGPRLLLCLAGEVVISNEVSTSETLRVGESVFVAATEGPLTAIGRGTLVQADVP